MAADSWVFSSGGAVAFGGWVLTYMVHSTLLLGLAWVATRRAIQAAIFRDLVWKAALVGGIVTATVQQVALQGWAPSVRMSPPAFMNTSRTVAPPRRIQPTPQHGACAP